MKKLATLGLIGALLGGQVSAQQEGTHQEDVKKYPVVYHEVPFNNILMIYANQPREIPLCQFGYEQNGVKFVDEVRLPYVIESTETMANFYRPHCNSPKYLGILHNHNNGICLLSEVDLERFINDDKATIESIVCYASVENNQIRMNHFIKSEIPDSIIKRFKR